ncbi:hypothetical protein [Cognatilysobacter segetis]|uniref:hypothetical protein n=1 Tax=Cognatilysobacter segetis TaxID=2492394 RepID=UPI00192E400C|nr:hypothetical protein [Lysobacter segetis]
MIRVLTAVAVLALLAACSKPEMPDKDKPVEPKATARHDDLARAVQAPLRQARASQAALDAASKAQDAAIDAATGDAAAP